ASYTICPPSGGCERECPQERGQEALPDPLCRQLSLGMPQKYRVYHHGAAPFPSLGSRVHAWEANPRGITSKRRDGRGEGTTRRKCRSRHEAGRRLRVGGGPGGTVGGGAKTAAGTCRCPRGLS